MPLPRHLSARNRNSHIRNAKERDLKKTSELDTICERHQIGDLSFRSCKFSDAEGRVTFIEHDHVRGNMRMGVLIVKAKELMPSADVVYDLVKLEKEKKERDEKKTMEEAEKVRDEIQRLQNAGTLDTLPSGDEHHNQLLQTLINKTTEEKDEDSTDITIQESVDTVQETTDTVQETTDNSHQQSIDTFDIQPTTELSSRDDTNLIDDNDHKKTEIEEKRLNALKQMRRELEKKANDKSGNKFYRKFMKDIKEKFTLLPEPDIKYLEVKAETTDMVIDNSIAYRIIMPDIIREHYIMFIGHLQMKSGLLREIDPTYGFDKVSREHSDLLDRIKAKEDSKTTEYDDKYLEEEFDDLEELCVSDEENNENNENNDKDYDIIDNDDDIIETNE